MDGCECSIRIIIVPLKERIDETNYFGDTHTTAEIMTETIMTASSLVK